MNNIFKLLLLIFLFFLLLFPNKSKAEIKKDTANHLKGWQGIIIDEIFPNPCDKDKDKEWIRLYNSANKEINLNGWFLIDSYGKGDGYLFTEDTWIEDDDYLILNRKKTNITLNNFKEKLYLYTNKEKLADSLNYSNAPIDMVYSYRENNFIWKHISERKADNCNLVTSNKTNLNNNTNTENKKYLSWKDLTSAQAEQEFKLKGIVVNQVGDIDKRYFLLSKDEKQSQIIQIYNHYKEFPPLEPGDIVELTGRFSKINDSYRLKTKNTEDIKIIQSSFLITPLNFDLNNLSRNKIYEIKGEVIKVNKDEIKVIYKNKKITLDISLLKNTNFRISNTVKLIGVLQENSKEIFLKILPFYPQNQKYIDKNITTKTTNNNKNYPKYLAIFSLFGIGFISWRYKP